jgi:hypothetical protein
VFSTYPILSSIFEFIHLLKHMINSSEKVSRFQHLWLFPILKVMFFELFLISLYYLTLFLHFWISWIPEWIHAFTEVSNYLNPFFLPIITFLCSSLSPLSPCSLPGLSTFTMNLFLQNEHFPLQQRRCKCLKKYYYLTLLSVMS